jgi:hypothetical protein
VIASVGPDLAITLVFFAGTGIWLWGLVSSIIRPGWAFRRAGSNKAMWIVLIAILGFIPAIIYLAGPRKKVMAAQAGGPAGPAWNYPGTQYPPGWHPDPSGRHEFRYWDGTRWTLSVSDQGKVGTDPFP